VFLHGTNAVYKHPPFELYPDPKKPWNFTAADASLMARLGFNVVRLGMTWKGLEPGTARANDPAICQKGSPGDPHQLNQRLLHRYLHRLGQTVNLLGRYHIYVLLDMHQDVYGSMFRGEGAPTWAVCTDGVASTPSPGRWSLAYGSKATGIAFHHFWTNDVVGDLQGQYDAVWGAVAKYFRTNPWVVGYDPFNEPFSTSVLVRGDEHFDGQLECFYTGQAHPGIALHGGPPIRCPPDDPGVGVVPTILANDPHHLIFDEPDIYASRGFPTFIGPMDYSHLVFNFHIYCAARSPVTGNPTNADTCAAQEARSFAHRAEDRPEMASAAQPGGPAWFVSEFGATADPAFLAKFTAEANRQKVGWAYWSWKYYDDPTGSADEALVMSNGRLRQTARVLAQTYPEAIAGIPTSVAYTDSDGTFRLAYAPNRHARAPTVIFVPTELHYPHGYCARVSGGSVSSSPDSELLQVKNAQRSSSVRVTVTAGHCKG
jgi:endoglycosylceramidase